MQFGASGSEAKPSALRGASKFRLQLMLPLFNLYGSSGLIIDHHSSLYRSPKAILLAQLRGIALKPARSEERAALKSCHLMRCYVTCFFSAPAAAAALAFETQGSRPKAAGACTSGHISRASSANLWTFGSAKSIASNPFEKRLAPRKRLRCRVDHTGPQEAAVGPRHGDFCSDGQTDRRMDTTRP